jgi:hypothetical protein
MMEYARRNAITVSVGMTQRIVKSISVHLGVLRICYIMRNVILSVITRSVTMMIDNASVRPNALLKLEMGKYVTRDVIHISATGMIINV